MSGIPFHGTGYGKRFFESQLPALIKNVGSLADAITRLVDWLEKNKKVLPQIGGASQ